MQYLCHIDWPLQMALLLLLMLLSHTLMSRDIAMCPLTSWGESCFVWQAVAKQTFCNTVEACRGLTNNALLIPIQK